jgi:hypothetical protein
VQFCTAWPPLKFPGLVPGPAPPFCRLTMGCAVESSSARRWPPWKLLGLVPAPLPPLGLLTIGGAVNSSTARGWPPCQPPGLVPGRPPPLGLLTTFGAVICPFSQSLHNPKYHQNLHHWQWGPSGQQLPQRQRQEEVTWRSTSCV